MSEPTPSPESRDKIVERLIDHAQRLWNSEENNSQRLEFRSRVVQAITFALLTFVGFAVWRSDMPEMMSHVMDDWLSIGVAAIVLSCLIFGALAVFAALANELRHAEDEFRFPSRGKVEDIAPPQQSWKEISVFFAIGEIVDILRRVLFSRGGEAINLDDLDMEPNAYLLSHYEHLE